MPAYHVTVLDTQGKQVLVQAHARDSEEAKKKAMEAEQFAQGSVFHSILEVEELPAAARP